MKRWWSPLGLASLLLAQACAGDDQTGVLLTIVSAGEAPTSLDVLWFDGDKRMLFRRRLPDEGVLPAESAGRLTLFIEIERDRLGPRRVVGYGKAGDRTISQGMARIDDFSGGRREVEVALGESPLADGDADGIPDEVDGCPGYPAADGVCPADPGAPTEIVGPDAGPLDPDAAVDSPPADAAPDAAPDRAPGAALDAAGPDRPPAPPAFTMGTFTRTAGPAGTEQRVLHDLGVTPRAVLLWTTARTSEGFGAGIAFSMGVSDGPGGTSRSLSFASADAVIGSQASRRIVDNLLSVGQPDGSTAAAATLVAWDAASLTLRWTTSGPSPHIVHVLLVGGEGVSARVIDWPTPSADGAFSVGGVGFQPEVAVNLHVGLGFTDPIPGVMEGGSFGLGVMTRAGRQWASALAIPSAVNPTEARRIQRTDAALYLLARDPGIVAPDAVLRSMDPDGFSLDFRNARAVPSRVVSLALAGIGASAGSFQKTAGSLPVEQEVTGLALRPQLVLLSSVLEVAQPEATPHARLVVGGSDGTQAACSSLSDTAGLPFTSARSLTARDRIFVKADQDRRLIEAEANLAALDEGRFSLRWLGNDLLPIQITYLALGAPR